MYLFLFILHPFVLLNSTVFLYKSTILNSYLFHLIFQGLEGLSFFFFNLLSREYLHPLCVPYTLTPFFFSEFSFFALLLDFLCLVCHVFFLSYRWKSELQNKTAGTLDFHNEILQPNIDVQYLSRLATF